jgi:uncharacterized membrane protein
MAVLVAGLIVFLGVHLVPALPPLRTALAARWGERAYRGLFSLVSLVGIVLIVIGYVRAPRGAELFPPSTVAIAIAPYAVTLALILFAAGNMRGHTRRIVKHPMLLGLAIWAAVHLAANGDTRGTVLFASFLGYAALDFASVVQRQAVKSFEPTLRHDVIGVIAGIVVALALMALHRLLFGVSVVPWGW